MAHIMVVDDDPLLRSMAAQALTRAGHAVQEVDNGRDAARLLGGQEGSGVEVLVTDIFMPDMDGLELIQEARKASGELRIIAISAGSNRIPMDFLPMATAFGANAVLDKPVTPPVLVACVDRLLTEKGK